MSEGVQERRGVSIRDRDIHTGDVVRVVADGQAVDPGAVIAVWPWTQEDFTPDRHIADLHVERRKVKDMTVDDPEWTTEERVKRRGWRVSLAAENGARYAVVDWNGTDAPPVLYLLLVKSEDPDARRWERMSPVQRIDRIASPVDCSERWCWCPRRTTPPSEDIPPWVVEQDAEPFFQPAGSGNR